jgi:putative transcriptional regulator
LFTIGLFFFAYSKEKIEDEMNYYIRIKSMALTLLFVIVSGILSPFLSYIFNDIPSIENKPGFCNYSNFRIHIYLSYSKDDEEMKNYLKVERAKLNITQQELADRINVSRQTINSIEADRYVPSTILAIKISNIFNTTVNSIFQLEEED